MIGAGKPGLVPVEVVLVAGLAVGQLDGMRARPVRRWKDLHPLWDAEVDFGGEAVGQVAGGGKPARGVEQIGDRLLDGCQLQAFDGAVFAAGDDAVVFECPMSGLAGDEGGGWRDADGAVGRALAGENLAGVIGDLVDLQGGMEAEADHLGVFRRGEGDGGLRREVMSGGVDLGVDDVAGDIERGAFRPLSGDGAVP